MGTDIDTWIEWDEDEGEPFVFGHNIRSLEIIVERNYTLFNALGDGRNVHFPKEQVEKYALYPPRGFPPHFSVEVYCGYYDFDDEGIAHSGSHTPSWLTPPEVRAALAHFEVERATLRTAWWLTLNVLEALEQRLGPERVRLMFWFDN